MVVWRMTTRSFLYTLARVLGLLLLVSLIACTQAPAAATPSATPTATASPTPEPTEDPAAGQYLDFADHISNYADEVVRMLTKVGSAATAGSISRLTLVSVDMWISTGNEVRWLHAHPPAPCYANVHAAYLNAMQLYHRAMDLISDGAATYDVRSVSRGTVLLNQGSDAIDQVTRELDSVICI